MDDHKCAFSAALMGSEFACVKAIPVTRRSGPDMACTSQPAHERCAEVFGKLKAVALPALGYEDDLLSMPHSALVKIQNGGLQGLSRLAGGIDDVDALLENFSARNDGLDGIVYESLVADITNYKIRRRR